MMRVISLGAGVQSTTLLLMALNGEFEVIPDAAIFADTGWEPKRVYEHLDWLEREVNGRMPIYRVQSGNIRTDAIAIATGEETTLRTAKNHSHEVTMPLYTRDKAGKVSMLRRQCTAEYKLKPIIEKERALLGLQPGRRARGVLLEQWVGISFDEVIRMKPSREAWKVHRWPLIEKRMTRYDCLAWLRSQGYPEPPKSACIGCPFHDDRRWRLMRDTDPLSWADAVEVDRAIRRLPRIRDDVFMHSQTVPLDEVDLSTPQDHGQLTFEDFSAECEGMCGI